MTQHNTAQRFTGYHITSQHGVSRSRSSLQPSTRCFARVELEVQFGVIRSHGVSWLVLVDSSQLEVTAQLRVLLNCLIGECSMCVVVGYAVGVHFRFLFLFLLDF